MVSKIIRLWVAVCFKQCLHSIETAVTEYPTLGGLGTTEVYFSQF